MDAQQGPQAPRPARWLGRLYWKVAEAPTGRYRAFHPRGWPMAYYDRAHTMPAVMLVSSEEGDDYSPAKARGEAKHAPLVIRIADYSLPSNPATGAGWTWRRLKLQGETLGDAQRTALRFLNEHPQYRPRRM